MKYLKFTKNKQLLAIVLSVLLVGGCKPFHKVYGTDSLKVYAVSIIDHTEYGKYEYQITDGTGKGWVLRTDEQFKIGDKLQITKKSN